MTIDVSRAFFHAPATRKIYVELPNEEGLDKSKWCARLNYSLYGTRDAPMNWALTYGNHLRSLGFRTGKSSPCLFWHPERSLRVLVHGDDYACVGPLTQLKWLAQMMRKKFEIKTQTLGPESECLQEIKLLNRLIRWTPHGIEYEADPRHQEIIIKELGLEGARALSTPGSKELPHKHDDEEPLLNPEATKYRAICARVNFLALDRPDLLFPAKECSRSMAEPKRKDWQKLKRVGRYLIMRPRVVIHFEWQSPLDRATGSTRKGGPEESTGYSDADWAGCSRTRRSTSGGVVTLGYHMIKAWSRTQATVALSSGESELYAMVKTSAELLGILSMLRDWGVSLKGHVLGDAAACLGVIQRQGLGKIRHLDTSYLWVQEKRAAQELQYGKILGAVNPADLMTKYLSAEDIFKHLQTLRALYTEGRSQIAPQVVGHVSRRDRIKAIFPKSKNACIL